MRGLKEFFLWLVVVLIYIFSFAKCQAQTAPFVYVKHKSYEVYYDVVNHSPAVVVYYLELSDFAGTCKLSGQHFKQDTKLPRPRVKDDDFKGSGYVRGHLCPAGDRDSNKSLMKDTYYCSNIVPMSMVTNSGNWKKTEDYARALATNGCKIVAAAVPLFMNCDTVFIGHTKVRVPGTIIKAVLCRDHPDECKLFFVGNQSSYFFTAVSNTNLGEFFFPYIEKIYHGKKNQLDIMSQAALVILEQICSPYFNKQN